MPAVKLGGISQHCPAGVAAGLGLAWLVCCISVTMEQWVLGGCTGGLCVVCGYVSLFARRTMVGSGAASHETTSRCKHSCWAADRAPSKESHDARSGAWRGAWVQGRRCAEVHTADGLLGEPSSSVLASRDGLVSDADRRCGLLDDVGWLVCDLVSMMGGDDVRVCMHALMEDALCNDGY